MKAIFRYINAKVMFEDYIPKITCRYLKMRGRGPFDQVMLFNEREKRYILEGIKRMADDLYKAYYDMQVEDIYNIGDKKVRVESKQPLSNHKKTTKQHKNFVIARR